MKVHIDVLSPRMVSPTSSGIMTPPRSLSAWMRQLGSIGEVHAWPGQGHDGACT